MGDGSKNFRDVIQEHLQNTQNSKKVARRPWLEHGSQQPHEDSDTTAAFNQRGDLYAPSEAVRAKQPEFFFDLGNLDCHNSQWDLLPNLLNPSTSDSWQLPRWSESDRPMKNPGNPTDALLLRTREGREGTVPKNFHNRPLLPTTGEENNCAIDAIAISYNPSLDTTKRKAIITSVRDTLVQEGYVESGEQIDLNKNTNNDKLLGQVLLEIMSEQGHIEKNCGLMVHSSHYSEIIGDQHQVVDGDKQIHIYLEDSQPVQHFWGMGPEIE